MSFSKFIEHIDLTNHKIQNVAAPTSGSDAANKDYVVGLISALNIPKSVVGQQDNLAAWLTAVDYAGHMSDYPAGSELYLPNASESATMFIHNGGSAGTSADWTAVQGSGLDASQVKALFSAGDGLSYSNGQFSISAAIKGFLGNGTDTVFSISVPIEDVVVSVKDSSSGELIGVKTVISGGKVGFYFDEAPSLNAYKYVIIPGY